MGEKKEVNKSKEPKKANLFDQNSIKHALDESVSEVVASRGYMENVRLSNVRFVMGTLIISIALFAQFYKKKFPENRDFLIACIVLYPFFPHSFLFVGLLLGNKFRITGLFFVFLLVELLGWFILRFYFRLWM